MPKRILLVLPPFFTPLTPPLGISILKSFLVERGYAVTCFDFNTLAQQWNMHHQYFERLQSLENVTIQDGYSKLWHILNDHMLAHMNGATADALIDVLPLIISKYGMESEPVVVNDLIALVQRYFQNFDATLFDLFDFSEYSHVGTSTYTTSLASSLHLLRAVKQRFPQITTIMGGGVFADDLALGSDNLGTLIDEYPFVDHIIIGEGEGLLLKLLQGDLKDIRLITTEDIKRVSLDMLEVPVPTFADFNMQDYYHLTIEGARSCPFQCSFCSETIQWGDYRKKPPLVLARQMIRLAQDYGNNTFFMGDSLMNPYIQELSKMLLEKKGQVLYDGYLRADKPVTHRDRVKLWAKSGLVRVRMGIESASTRVLTMMDKMTTPENITETLKSLATAGVRTTTYWIVGFPGETEDDFQETLDFISDNHRYIYELEAHPHLYYPYGQVGSRLYESFSLYPEEVTRFTKFKKWEIVDNKPTRREKFDRLRRLSNLAAELGLINIYTEEARYHAERRWHGLYPLVTEVAKGALFRREKARFPDAPVEAFSNRVRDSALVDSPASEEVLCYRVTLKKTLNEDHLRASIGELICNNEMLQMRLVGQEYVPILEETKRDKSDWLAVRPAGSESSGEFAADDFISVLSKEVRPDRGTPIKVALVQGEDLSSELFLLAHRSILDGRGLVLLLEDLFRIYEQVDNDKEVSLLPVSMTYSDFTLERRRTRVAENELAGPPSNGPENITPAEDTSALSDRTEIEKPPQKSITLPFGSELLKSIFAPALVRYDLRPGEVFSVALQRVLTRNGATEPLVFEVNDDYRNLDERLTRTVGALTRRCQVSCRLNASDNLLKDIRQIRHCLRDAARLDAEAVPNLRAVGKPDSLLLDLEYLVREPWLGGDEWGAQGFEMTPQSVRNSHPIRITPVCARGGLEVHLQYDNVEQVKAIVETLTNRLLPEVVAILEHCEHYVAAERFWLNEFDGTTTQSASVLDGLDLVEPEGSNQNQDRWDTIARVIERGSLEQLQSECNADSSVIILAAFGLLLSRLNGRDDLMLLMAHVDDLQATVAPIRIRALGSISFKEFVQDLQGTIRQVLLYGVHAFDILTKAGKLSEDEDSSLIFDVGIQTSVHASGHGEINFKLTSTNEPAARHTKLVLNICQFTEGTTAECAFAPAHFEPRNIEIFLSYLDHILEEAGRNVNLSLDEINLNGETQGLPITIIQDAADAFCFG